MRRHVVTHSLWASVFVCSMSWIYGCQPPTQSKSCLKCSGINKADTGIVQTPHLYACLSLVGGREDIDRRTSTIKFPNPVISLKGTHYPTRYTDISEQQHQEVRALTRMLEEAYQKAFGVSGIGTVIHKIKHAHWMLFLPWCELTHEQTTHVYDPKYNTWYTLTDDVRDDATYEARVHAIIHNVQNHLDLSQVPNAEKLSLRPLKYTKME